MPAPASELENESDSGINCVPASTVQVYWTTAVAENEFDKSRKSPTQSPGTKLRQHLSGQLSMRGI